METNDRMDSKELRIVAEYSLREWEVEWILTCSLERTRFGAQFLLTGGSWQWAVGCLILSTSEPWATLLFVGGGCVVSCRMFSSILGFYPPDASGIPPPSRYDNQTVADIVKCTPRARMSWVENRCCGDSFLGRLHTEHALLVLGAGERFNSSSREEKRGQQGSKNSKEEFLRKRRSVMLPWNKVIHHPSFNFFNLWEEVTMHNSKWMS